jgi:glutamate-1-semialdehyde 2,1-aminomutase
MGAVRLARGYTARGKILKFANSYHGHADYLLARAGSGLATLSIAASNGVPRDFIKHTLVAPFGDFNAVEKIFKKYGHKIAAVLVEPVGANFGVIPPDLDFLKALRHLSRKYAALLIFDEIITAFRFRFGSAAEQFDIVPDLICLGKIIGGGLPIGAYGGAKKIMRHLAPLGKVYQASTFSGNPIVMRSGLATLNALEERKSDYSRIRELAGYLCLRLEEEAQLYGVDLKISYYATMFSLKFKDKRIFRRFYLRLLEKGVYFAPSEFEANFLSFAHTKSDIEQTVIAARLAFKKERE